MKLDLVWMTHGTDLRFLRPGGHPPLRGTYIKLWAQETLLLTSGYIPELRDYAGHGKRSADPDRPSTRRFNEENDLRSDHDVYKAQLEFLLLRREASDNRTLG